MTSAPRLGRRGLAAVRAQLSDRDVAVVSSVAAFRFLTGRQLERLRFPPPPGSSATSRATAARVARRVLARLSRDRLLVRLERRVGGVRAGSASFVYALGPVGQRLIDPEATRPRRHEPSITFLLHTLAVADVYVGLVAAERAGRVEISQYQTEPACWRRYPALSGEHWLKPDLFVVLVAGDFEYHAFVEVDCGSEHLPALLRKCRQYEAYYRSGQEQVRRGLFPRVVWLMNERRRAERLRAAIRQDQRLSGELYAVGCPAAAVVDLLTAADTSREVPA